MNFPPKKSVLIVKISSKHSESVLNFKSEPKSWSESCQFCELSQKLNLPAKIWVPSKKFLCKCLCLVRLSWTQRGWFLIQDPRKTVPALDQGKVGPHITMPRLSRPIQIAWCFTIANKVRESYKIEWCEEIANCPRHTFCGSQ